MLLAALTLLPIVAWASFQASIRAPQAVAVPLRVVSLLSVALWSVSALAGAYVALAWIGNVLVS